MKAFKDGKSFHVPSLVPVRHTLTPIGTGVFKRYRCTTCGREVDDKDRNKRCKGAR